jgi:hypothetical protein
VVLDFGEGVYLGPQLEDDRPERAMSVQDEKKLCLAFATPLSRAWCDSPFLVAPTGGERMVGLHGVGLEDGDGAGVAFFHRGTPGYHLDRREGVLRNVLAWGPREWIYASDNSVTRGRSRYTALRGRQEYEYAILPYTPRGARFVLPRAALDFRLPCRWQMLQALSGRPAVPRSFLSVEPESVLATALFVHWGRVYHPPVERVRAGGRRRHPHPVGPGMASGGPAAPARRRATPVRQHSSAPLGHPDVGDLTSAPPFCVPANFCYNRQRTTDHRPRTTDHRREIVQGERARHFWKCL